MIDVLDELREVAAKLNTFPSDAHWFCPKINEDDGANYDEPDVDDEDATAPIKRKRIQESEIRLQTAYRMTMSYGLSPEENAQIQDAVDNYTFKSGILLTSCDKCVRNYHMARSDYQKSLCEIFDETIVMSLMELVEQADHGRIERGIQSAISVLKLLPPEKRGMRGLLSSDVGQSCLQALFEALCCVSYHKSKPQALCEAMELVQATKILRLGYMVPAMTRWLFDDNAYLYKFAVLGFTKTNQRLNKRTFDWIIQDSLIDAIQRHSMPQLQFRTQEELERFWQGVVLIVGRLNKELIIHSLGGLEVSPNIYHLALEHLSRPSEVMLQNIIEALVILIGTAPNASWAAYGAIAPTIVVEQIFNNPSYAALLEHAKIEDVSTAAKTAIATSWIPVFLESLSAGQQNELCRSMITFLFIRLQGSSVPWKSRMTCLQAGLGALDVILTTYTAPSYDIHPSTSFIMINNALELVDKFKDILVGMGTLQEGKEGYAELAGPALKVVGKALFLDCSALKAEFTALEKGLPVDYGLNNHTGTLWKTVMDSFRPDDMRLTDSVLHGVTPLIGIEEFRPMKQQSLPADKERFNGALSQLTEVVANIFERISEFSVENLRLLYKNTTCSQPLFGGLVSAHSDTYAAAVELIKTLTGQDSRKDAICGVLNEFMENFLTAINVAAKKVNLFKTFAAVPNLLKTGGDVLDGLFDAQKGVLRIKPSFSRQEQAALLEWWSEQWVFVKTSFQMVEDWSRYHDNDMLKEFCRDDMDFADKLFDQYAILATSISRRDGKEAKMKDLVDGKAESLVAPSEATSTLLHLLRLKDHHLVGTAVNLLCKILRCLGDFNIQVDEDTSDRIDQILHGRIKTVLSGLQKAALRKSIEENFGIEEVTREAVVSKKQGRIDSYYGAGVVKNERGEPSSGGATPTHGREIIDVESLPSRPLPSTSIKDDLRSLSSSVEHGKSTLDQIRARQQQQIKLEAAKPRMGSLKAVESLKQSRQREKDEKRKRDAEAVALAHSIREKVLKGEGSGIVGLGGVLGKDHAPARGTMMVSSSEDSDSEDEGDRFSLLKRGGKKPISKFEAERRAAAKLPQGPVKKPKIHRSAKDMRARLTPDMSQLHSIILKWDIFHQGDSPPSGLECSKVPPSFPNHIEYQNSFYPLLVEEAWKQLSSERDQTSGEPFDIIVVNRMTVDSFIEVSTTMTLADNKRISVGESDIIILSKGQNPLRDQNSSHLLGRVHNVKRKKDVVEVVYKVNLSAISGGSDSLSLQPGNKIRGFKLTSITSIEREYAAMKSLQYYDLIDEILEARPSPLQKYNDYILQPIQKVYELNSGQAGAIWSAKENDAFTLIQGPPGSGKTKTIAAMVGALLTEQLNKPTGGVAIGRPIGHPAGRQAPPPLPKKLLLCAPSNAAVDELVSRLLGGVVDMKGRRHKIEVTRLGQKDKVNFNVMEATLDRKVEKRLEGEKASGKAVVSERAKLHEQAGKLKAEIAELRPKLEEARTNNDKTTELRIQREIDERKRMQARIGTKIDEDKDSGNTAARDHEINRRRVQQEVINESHVLCSTLSGSGHDMFKNLNVEFETVIIDEAAQSIEVSSLIPLKYGCNKCILVGDPKQLPPTVLSKMSAKFGYEKSLFVRMQENYPDRIHLLDTQYRMHPEISHFPSKTFYDGLLIDGPGLTKLRAKPWHSRAVFGPYQFFDVKGLGGRSGTSLTNMAEVDVALQLYARLRSEFPSYDFKNKIGIITPYKGQLRAIQSALVRKYGEEILGEVDTNTTDAYQGREAEIIIFSCVRATPGSIGFLDDIRRMNVGLTRAKSSMWVLGDSRSLMAGEYWQKLINDAKDRKRFTEGDVLNMLKRPLAKAIDYSTSVDKEVEMKDVDDKPAVEKPKHPIRRPSSRDGPNGNGSSVKQERQNSSTSASSTGNGVKVENSHEPAGKPANANNGLPARPGMPKLTAVGNIQPPTGKRTREPSPTESGPPRKMPMPNLPPGLRIPGQPKPPSVPAAPGQTLPNGQPLNGGAKPNPPKMSAAAGLKPRPRMMAPRKPADPFLSSKPKPKRP